MSDIIKKIELDLGDKKTVSLTPKQAKCLKEALDELFGEKVIREDHHHHHDHYDYWQWWNPYPVTCGTVTFPERRWICGNDVKAQCNSAGTMTLRVA